MNFNKNKEKKENSNFHKRAKSFAEIKNVTKRDKLYEKYSEPELIHLSLIIDETNKISLDFYQDQDVSEICENLEKKFKLGEKIKIKLKERIIKNIEEFEDQTMLGEKTIIANNVIKRLYNDSVEKRKNLKLKNEEVKKAREEEEFKKFRFSPLTSAYNMKNIDRQCAKIEDKLYQDHFKKNKNEVERVLKEINKFNECKQFIYKKNILKKNPYKENNYSKESNNNLKPIFPRNDNCNFSQHNENKSVNINSISSLHLHKNAGKIEATNNPESLESIRQEEDIKHGPTKTNTLTVLNEKENKYSGVLKVLKRGESIKTDLFSFSNKKISKKSMDNNNISRNTNNNLTNQNISGKYNTTTSLNNIQNSHTQKIPSENNLIIPQEQTTSNIKNLKKSYYVDMNRKTNYSSSNLSNISCNTSKKTKLQLSNENLQNAISRQTSQATPNEEETKKSVGSNTINYTIYNNLNSPTLDLENTNKSNNFKTRNIGDISNKFPDNVKFNRNKEATLFRKNSKLKEENKVEEIKYASPRNFSFKDFQDFGGFSLNKPTKEENLNLDNTENEGNKKNESPLDSPEFTNKRISTVKSNVENKDIIVNYNYSNIQNNPENPVKLFAIKDKKISDNKNPQKSESIFNRLYKLHQDIKIKKEKHIEHVIRNLCPFKPNINKHRPKSLNLTSKCFSVKNENKKNKNIFDRLYNSSKIQRTKSFFSYTSLDHDFPMAKPQIKTEGCRNFTSINLKSKSSFRNKDKIFLSYREQTKENELYNSFVLDNKVKEKLKIDIHDKISYNMTKFKLNILKEMFEMINKNCRNVEDFHCMEKFGISNYLKDNIILPTLYFINENNLDFNFNNFSLIANEVINHIIN